MLTPLDKRIVLIHCKGPWKGILQILGTQSDTLAAEKLEELPAFIEEVEMGDGRKASVSMIRVTPRIIYYRENTPPIGGKLNEFHPAQT
jgi:hypothetical protein